MEEEWGGGGKERDLGVELQLLAVEVLVDGVDVVVEEVEEIDNAGDGDDDGGAGGRSLLGDLEVAAARVFFEVEVEQLVLHLQRPRQQLHVAVPTARSPFHLPFYFSITI